MVSACMICNEICTLDETFPACCNPRINPAHNTPPFRLPSSFPITSLSLILIHLLHPYHSQLLLNFISSPLSSFTGTVGRRGCAFLDVIGALLSLVFGFLAATRSSNLELVEHPLGTALDLGEDAGSRGVCAVAEVLRIATCHGLQLVCSGALIGLDAVRVKVGFEL